MVDITLVDVVLFLHVAVAVVTFGIASILLTGMVQMRSAQEMSVLRSWAGVTGRIEPAFPVLVLDASIGSRRVAYPSFRAASSDGAPAGS